MPFKFVFVPMGYEDNIIESKLFLEWTCPLRIRILCILPIFFYKIRFFQYPGRKFNKLYSRDLKMT